MAQTYHCVVTLRLGYGCIVSGSARPTTLKMLDPVHHQCLHLAIGAFRTYPVASFYAEAYEWPLEKCRSALALSYALKVGLISSQPPYNAVTPVQYERTFQNKLSVMPPFGIRVRTTAQSL